jgi:N,N'-diacetyllegionaminate synthase
MVFIIAEIGVNWDGDFELAKEMIVNAKNAGCSAVKFQSFTEELIKNHPEKSRLIKSSIDGTNINEISEITKKNNIEFLCTPMYPHAVNIIEPFVKKFKIREYDSRKIFDGEESEIFENVIKTNKEILMSCHKSPKSLPCYGNHKIKYLYCVPKYPTSLEELDFIKISDFDGYSNHSPEIIAPLTAVILGTKIIEIHVTNNKNENYIDNNVSLDFNELKVLIQMFEKVSKIKIGINQ